MNRPQAAIQPDAPRQWLSDLADGRLDDDALSDACRRWEADVESRRTWHAYQLIGDVLRSDDLARAPAVDCAFLNSLRQRLADEPVVLAPTPPTRRTTRSHRQLWLLPMAAAAGFVAVAGVMVVLQQAAPGSGFDGGQIAGTPPSAVNVRAAASPDGVRPAGLPAATAGAPGQMLRDARIEDYLRAHREVLMGSPVALPGGAARTVDFEPAAPQR